jgi:hypothetical protein
LVAPAEEEGRLAAEPSAEARAKEEFQQKKFVREEAQMEKKEKKKKKKDAVAEVGDQVLLSDKMRKDYIWRREQGRKCRLSCAKDQRRKRRLATSDLPHLTQRDLEPPLLGAYRNSATDSKWMAASQKRALARCGLVSPTHLD